MFLRKSIIDQSADTAALEFPRSVGGKYFPFNLDPYCDLGYNCAASRSMGLLGYKQRLCRANVKVRNPINIHHSLT